MVLQHPQHQQPVQQHEIITADGRVMIVKGQPITYTDGTQHYLLPPGVQPPPGLQPVIQTIHPSQAQGIPTQPQPVSHTQTISRATYNALDLQQHQVVRGPPPPSQPGAQPVAQPAHAMHVPPGHTPIQQVGVTRPMYSALQPAPRPMYSALQPPGQLGVAPTQASVTHTQGGYTAVAPQQISAPGSQPVQHMQQQATNSNPSPRMYSALQPPKTSTPSAPATSTIRPMYSALQPPNSVDGHEVLDTSQYLRESPSPRQTTTPQTVAPLVIAPQAVTPQQVVSSTPVDYATRDTNPASWQSAAQIQELMAMSGSNPAPTGDYFNTASSAASVCSYCDF